MKNIRIYLALAVLFIASACNDDFLDTDNLFEKSLDNFYNRPQDIEEALAGAYHAFYVTGVTSEESLVANLLSDNMLAGGGVDDPLAKYIDGFEDPTEDTYIDLWKESYNGIARANAIIENTVDADFSDYFLTAEDAVRYKNQAIGEGYFLRAYFYFRLAKFFGGVPLVLSYDAPRDVPRASLTETYSVIVSDLKLAIEMMPEVQFQSIPTSEYGRANRWIAEAYMARVYLYYTGYMANIEKQSSVEIPLLDGGSITQSNVVDYLNDCIQNSGYDLVDDFRNLWPYSYVNASAGETVLPWANSEGLEWVGQDGYSPSFGSGNIETMLSIRYAFGSWDNSGEDRFHNRTCLYFGIRGNSLVPFGQGWGWGTVKPSLWNGWPNDDVRKEGSILELGNDEQGTGEHVTSNGDHETGFVNKKYTIIQHGGEEGVAGMFYYMYNQSDYDYMLSSANDFQLLRFADVLLMHSELTETVDGINRVRGRVELDALGGYSLEALKAERLYEFAFEGLRWFDLVRWGDVESAFDETVDVLNDGTPSKYKVSYRPETKGLLPIPETEIRLSNGVYEQNPGWE